MNPAGDTENDWETVDLCPTCLVKVMQRAFDRKLSENILDKPAREIEYGKLMWESFKELTRNI